MFPLKYNKESSTKRGTDGWVKALKFKRFIAVSRAISQYPPDSGWNMATSLDLPTRYNRFSFQRASTAKNVTGASNLNFLYTTMPGYFKMVTYCSATFHFINRVSSCKKR